jgi:P27 family predicted phage terminase small subunit
MRGRKPLPTHLKLVTGNPGRRPLELNEPRPQPALPTVPEHLSDEAKVEWGRLAHELHELGILTRIDRASLAAYCQAYADWAEAEANLRRYGKMITSPKRTVTRRRRDGSEVTETSGGYPMQSPFLAMRNKALELMHKFAIEFGMSPSSRSRVSVKTPGEADDPAHKYI